MTIGERLVVAGMSTGAAQAAERLFAATGDAHATMQPASLETKRLWVPGRIEVLGKHTDYAGGRSLLCAVERGFAVTASPRSDGEVNVAHAANGECIRTSLVAGAPDGWVSGSHWSNYIHTVVRRMARDFPPLHGADIAIGSNLPIAAGMSSSSALVTAIFLAIAGANGLRERPAFRAIVKDDDSLAGYLGALENGLPFGNLAGARGVGTFGGSEDHAAMLRARAGALVRYRFCPVHFEDAVPLPSDHSFVVASSGIRAEKTGDALADYNRLSTLTRSALERWNALSGRDDPTLGDAVAACGEEVVRRLGDDSPELAQRVEHFLIESEIIIPSSVSAIAEHDLAGFGALVDRSMANADRLLRNQVPETVFLARRARGLGAVAASAFGAGFGGSVWAMVPTGRATEIRDALRTEYATAFPDRGGAAELFVTAAGPPAQEL